MLKPEDLSPEIREILNQPCSTCGKKGIHDCKYDEKKLLERLEKQEEEKEILKPEKVERFSYKSKPQRSKGRAAPKISLGCSSCKKKVQAKDGLCIKCTEENRKLHKNKPIILRNKWGEEIAKTYKHGN